LLALLVKKSPWTLLEELADMMNQRNNNRMKEERWWRIRKKKTRNEQMKLKESVRICGCSGEEEGLITGRRYHVKTQVWSPLLRSNLNLKLFVEDEESIEHERKKREWNFYYPQNLILLQCVCYLIYKMNVTNFHINSN
jgi:hypothetical protein